MPHQVEAWEVQQKQGQSFTWGLYSRILYVGLDINKQNNSTPA